MTPRTILLALAAAVLVSACVPDSAETPAPTPETPPTTTTSAAPPSPSPEPTASTSAVESFPPPPADETEEEAAIREGWMNYWRTYAKFLANPDVTDFTETQLVTVSGSEQARVILDSIQRLRYEGWKVEGDHVFRDFAITQSPSESDGTRSVSVSYCYDGTHKQVVDAATGVEVSTSAADTYRETAWLDEGADGVWRVSLVGNEAAAC